ncbi:MAG TPA: hypothetical protein PLA50_11825 [Bacteroidia bacterium]|nr:hypothetical protein [Bacteroidia bacterium]
MMKAPFALLAIAAMVLPPLLSQEPANPPEAATPMDPFVKEKGGIASAKKAKTEEEHINVGILFQHIDVKRERWRDWLSQHSVPLDAGPLRQEVEGWIAAGDATLAETSLVMGRSGQRSKVESVREIHYPHEYNLPQDGGMQHGTALEPYTLGTTTEVDPVLELDGSVAASTAPGRSAYAGEAPVHAEAGVEEGDVRWPRFVEQRVIGDTTFGVGEWSLLGGTSSLERPDTHLTLLFARSILHRFVEKAAPPSARGEGIVTLRWLEIPHADLNTGLMAKGDLSDWIGGDLFRQSLDAGAKPVEERSIRFRSGNRHLVSTAENRRYPFEFIPSANRGELSRPLSIKPLQFGTTVEVDPVFNERGTLLDLGMMPEIVAPFGKTVHHRILVNGVWQPNSTTPVVYRMKASTGIVLPLNTPVLVAIMSPPDEKGWTDPSRKVLLFVEVSR